jgi:hypothetical protein
MCPQAPRLSPEYCHKVGLQTVITEKPLQIRPVTHLAALGLLQWAEFPVGLQVGRGRGTGRPRCKPSSCSVVGEGLNLSVVSPPLVQRDWRRHQVKGSVFAFAPTAVACAAASTSLSGQTPANLCSGWFRDAWGCTVEARVAFITEGAGVDAGLARRGATRVGRAPRACSGVARARRTRGRVHLPEFLRLQSSKACESRQMSCARSLPGT